MWKKRTEAYYIEAITDTTTVPFKLVYSGLVSGGTRALGGCGQWSVLTRDDLPLALISYFPVSIKLASTEHYTDDFDSSIRFCNNTSAVRKLVDHLSSASSLATPSNFSVSCRGRQWTVGKCTGSSNPYICIDCPDYCATKTATPPAHLVTCSSDVSKASDFMRMLIVEFEDVSVPPAITSMYVNGGPSSIVVRFKVDNADGSIVCGSYLPTERVPKTVNEITVRGAMQSLAASRGNYTISGLVPSTTYHIYCGTLSNLNVPSKQSEILATKKIIKSACCRQLQVDIRLLTQLDSQDVANAVRVSLGERFLPEKEVVISLTAKNSTGHPFPAMFAPRAVKFTPSSKTRSYSLSYLKAPVGVYSLAAALTGEGADEYSARFISGNSITVLSSAQEPTVPVFTSAIFSSDGSSIALSFDSPSNRGLYVNFFTCSSVFSNTLLSSARCQWVSDTIVRVTTTGAGFNIGDSISLKANTIKAKCIASALTCQKWNYSAIGSVPVAAPPSPVVPIINVVAPAQIGPCGSLLLDLTGSVGAGSRPFKSLKLTVASTDTDIAPLRRFLQNVTSIQSPIDIKNTLLHAGFAYNIRADVCNFLSACSTMSHRFVVSTTANVPVVSINAQRLIEIQRNAALRVTGNAYIPTCDGQQSRENIEFTWTISRDQVPLTLSSASSDPTLFRLPPFSLAVGGLYQVSLTAIHMTSLKKSSASVSVAITTGNLVANIVGPSSRGLRVGDVLRLDASASYDEDKDGDIEHMLFSFQCIQTAPDVLNSCPLGIAAISDRVIELLVPDGLSLVDTVHEITLFVSSADDPRTAKTSVLVTILPSLAPLITLYTEGNPRINPSDKLKLVADVSVSSSAMVSWEVDDSSILLPQISLSDTSKPLVVQPPSNGTYTMSRFRVSLVLPSFSLSEQSSFTFTLFCNLLEGTSSSSASVTVTTNSPPYPGDYVVIPPSGVRLKTEFMFQALQWEDSDLPIAYEFSYENPASGEYVVHRARMEVTFVYSKLPAGLSQMDYALDTRVQVFDSLNAKRVQNFVVTVNVGDKLSLQDIDAYFGSAVNNASGFAGNTCHRVYYVLE
jgi:hypothetical protein